MATPQREGPGKSGQQSREQGGGRPSRGSLGARAVQARRCLPNAVVCLTPACLLRRKSTASVPIPSSRPAIATSASRRQHVLRHTRRHTSRKSSGRDWSEMQRARIARRLEHSSRSSGPLLNQEGRRTVSFHRAKQLVSSTLAIE